MPKTHLINIFFKTKSCVTFFMLYTLNHFTIKSYTIELIDTHNNRYYIIVLIIIILYINLNSI